MKHYLYTLTLTLATLLLTACDKEIIEERYLGSPTPDVQLYSIDENNVVSEAQSVVRGRKVRANIGQGLKIEKIKYYPVELSRKQWLYAKESSLVSEQREVVQERKLYVRTPASIITNRETSLIGGLADKGDEVEILDYDTFDEKGLVNRYHIRHAGVEGYIYGKYLVTSKSEAQKRYMAEKYDKVHRAVKNPFGGGEAIGCDFYPREREVFEGNTMPEACYSLYLNISPAVLRNIEAYIALAKRTKINTFTIDIKDNECPGYKAEAMKLYSPTNYRYAGDKETLYKQVVSRLKEEGFYVVGRITCFKDSHFVKDHPECAITERATGKPFKHNKAYWPSAYDRRVWQFNVELAKEAVRKFGFNEINFDYVRFPDRMTKIEKIINYHNRHNESKVQAIQRFAMYACDEIHAIGAYVSIDVFGEAANPGYTTAYGQYWPALSNVADVMCGMPYPDHFSNGYYGVKKPWNHPYQILNEWGKRVQDRQRVTPTPAKVRTWVQAYKVMRHIDRNGLDYDAADVEREIRGLYDAGLTGGYTTWLSSSNIEKYKKQEAAFKIDYLKEYKKKNKK
ncbi:MAG: hypothetical protein IKA70_01970 [Alistipes sp.]|nr:hypothetical protein [Alistipes sp.]